MNKRIIIYIAGGLLFIAIVIGVLYWVGVFGTAVSQTAPVESAAEQAPASEPPFAPAVMNIPGAPQGDTFAIGTPQGSVTVNNFYKLPVELDEEFLVLADNNDYQINYDTETSQFSIYASSSPVMEAQQKGEAALLALLGISESDACKLNVVEDFPASSQVAGQHAGLSFCPITAG